MSTLSPILNKKKNKPNQKSINKLIIDGKTVYNDKQIANALNEYFSSVGNTLLNKSVIKTGHIRTI